MKYCPEVVADICKCLEVGTTIKDACLCCGIGEVTHYEWVKKYQEYADEVEAAQARFRQKNLARIDTAATDDWKAAAWALERRGGKDYAKREIQDQNITVEKLPEIKVTWE